MQPGDTIQPGESEETAAVTEPEVEEPAPVEDRTPAGDDQTEPEPTETAPQINPMTWQASEYVHHAKSATWYAGLVGGLVVLVAIAVWAHQWMAIAVFLAMFAAVVVYARKQPRTLSYTIDNNGITIENKTYPFNQFRSFGVLEDVAWHAIDLEPTQRFMPRLTILFEADNLDQIVDRLETQLPRLDRKPDVIERATRYLRF